MSQSTIKDVAREAKVSIGTVDRVLHGRGRVSDTNNTAVLAAVEKLNYRPSQIARALVKRKDNLRIGITYPNVGVDFWSEIPNGIDAARNKLLPFGVELVIDHSGSYDIYDQVQSIDRLVASNVNGILFTSVDDATADQIEAHIPSNISYATVINPTASVSNCAFHVGPDDFLLGTLTARLISLFCGETSNIVLLAPNYNFNGTQLRIAGILSKISQELTHLNLLKVVPISGTTDEEIRSRIYYSTIEIIRAFPTLNAIYVSNGFFDQSAFAVRDLVPGGKIKVFGHEYASSLPELLEKGIVAATIYQKPAEQWYQAILLLYELLSGNKANLAKEFRIECSIIMKETLSSLHIGDVSLL